MVSISVKGETAAASVVEEDVNMVTSDKQTRHYKCRKSKMSSLFLLPHAHLSVVSSTTKQRRCVCPHNRNNGDRLGLRRTFHFLAHQETERASFVVAPDKKVRGGRSKVALFSFVFLSLFGFLV